MSSNPSGDVNDVFEVFTEILKSRFTRARNILLYSIAIGAVIGLVAGFNNYNSAVEYGYIDENPSLVGYILADTLRGAAGIPIALAILILVYSVFWFPSDIAKRRGHSYTSIIQILTIAGLFTVGILWFAAAIWAIYPSEKSLIDPIAGNPTGLGRRNAGDTVGATFQGVGRGRNFEKDTDREIDVLIDMRAKGLISDEEFLRKKQEILKRDF